jgi:hypothetical protein
MAPGADKRAEDLWTALLGHRTEIALCRDFANADHSSSSENHYARRGDDRNHAAVLHQRESSPRSGGSSRQPRAGPPEPGITERLGEAHGQAFSLHQLGRIAEERGDAAEAAAL